MRMSNGLKFTDICKLPDSENQTSTSDSEFEGVDDDKDEMEKAIDYLVLLHAEKNRTVILSHTFL